jgi:hypothetical protein
MIWLVTRSLVLLSATAPLMIPGDRVLEDQTTETLVFRKLAVPAQTFSRQYATQQARQFIADNATMKLTRLTWVPDEKPATYSLFGCDHCDPYRFWRAQWDPISKVIFPVAELMSVEGNSVLRFRDKSGAVSAVVLQGSDPRPIRIGGYQGRIIQVGMSGRIEFRADPWFIDEIWRPFLPLFDTSDSVPTEEMFKSTRTPYCSYFTPANNKCSWEGVVTLP